MHKKIKNKAFNFEFSLYRNSFIFKISFYKGNIKIKCFLFLIYFVSYSVVNAFQSKTLYFATYYQNVKLRLNVNTGDIVPASVPLSGSDSLYLVHVKRLEPCNPKFAYFTNGIIL